MKFNGKNILIYGMGASGKSARDFLKSKKANVYCYDDSYVLEDEEAINKTLNRAYDLCVLSPGVKIEKNLVLDVLKEQGVRIISEIGLGLMFAKGKLICVTGTNGKTTTVSLLANILKEAGKEVFLCGNVGLPVTAIADKTKRGSYIVAEVSSFMLESTQFKPYVSAILNVTEDHIDRHGCFENYLKIKLSLFQHQTKGLVVLNFDDENLKTASPKIKTEFFSREYITNGAHSERGKVYYKNSYVLSTSLIRLLGSKNLENVLACVNICRFLKIKPEAIKLAIANFNPLKNRLEGIGCKSGVMFVNDSKATNVDGTICALRAYDGYPLLLLGGRNKGANFDPVFKEKFKTVYAYGECRADIIAAARKYGREVLEFENLREATRAAYNNARIGDIVLLSPACASFDEFKDYADRGDKFKEYFAELENIEKN